MGGDVPDELAADMLLRAVTDDEWQVRLAAAQGVYWALRVQDWWRERKSA